MFTGQVLKATKTVYRTSIIQLKELFPRWTPAKFYSTCLWVTLSSPQLLTFLELLEAPSLHRLTFSRVASPQSPLKLSLCCQVVTGHLSSLRRAWISGPRKTLAFIFEPPHFKDVLRAACLVRGHCRKRAFPLEP